MALHVGCVYADDMALQYAGWHLATSTVGSAVTTYTFDPPRPPHGPDVV